MNESAMSNAIVEEMKHRIDEMEFPNKNLPESAERILERIFGKNSEIQVISLNDHRENSKVKIVSLGDLREKPPVAKVEFPKDLKFTYYGCTGECNHHDGVIVIASRVNNEMVEYGVAYCSPKDIYSKETGKIYASNNLIDENKMVALAGKKHHLINARILADIVANADAPSWAEEKVAWELARHLFFTYNDTFTSERSTL